MQKTIEKKKSSVKSELLTVPLEPFALRHYPGSYLQNAQPCGACGAAAARVELPPDEYDRTLLDAASRTIFHASADLCQPENARQVAGLLRDAARMLDLLAARQSARSGSVEGARSTKKVAQQ